MVLMFEDRAEWSGRTAGDGVETVRMDSSPPSMGGILVCRKKRCTCSRNKKCECGLIFVIGRTAGIMRHNKAWKRLELEVVTEGEEVKGKVRHKYSPPYIVHRFHHIAGRPSIR